MGIQRQRTPGKALLRGESHDQLATSAWRQLSLIKVDVCGLEGRNVLLVFGLHDEDLGLRQSQGSDECRGQGKKGQRDWLTSLPQTVPFVHGEPSMRA